MFFHTHSQKKKPRIMDICFSEVFTGWLVPSQIFREGSSLTSAMKTETRLTQPKWHTHRNFNPPFPHYDHSTCGLCTMLLNNIFFEVSLFLILWRRHAKLTYHLRGVWEKGLSGTLSPVQFSFVLGRRKQFVRRVLLSVRCHFGYFFSM